MSIFLNIEYGRNKLSVRQIMSNPVLFLAFGFGSGLVKKMPGTIGTIAAIPVYLLFIQTDAWLYSVLTALVVITGFWICGNAAKLLGEHDFGGIVWDEVAGFLITMWLVPFSWTSVLIGFILFRFFDILKPWPIKWVDQQVGGGLGIMLDDVLAGGMAAVILLLIV
ncbi:MAG: phosphatidylglycerophosphatase A [Methylococcaceae bacterium]|nr:phosphatidylglycerophosphatase A [Methylococcaceae bacterium]